MELTGLSGEGKIFLYMIIIIIFCFLGGLPILLNKRESESKHYISINFLFSGLILLILTILTILTYLFLDEYHFHLLILLSGFFTTLFSGIHGLYYKKKINSVVYNRFFISDILISIVILIPIILLLTGYFNK